MPLTYAPWVYDLFFCFITLWPTIVILRRMGLPVWWAALSLASLVLPFLGQMLLLGLLAVRPWPKLPMPKRKQGRAA